MNLSYFCDFSRCKLLDVHHPTDDMQMAGKFGTGNSVELLRGDNANCNSNSFNLSREQLTPFYQLFVSYKNKEIKCLLPISFAITKFKLQEFKFIYGKRDRQADRHIIKLAYPSDKIPLAYATSIINKGIQMHQATVNVNTFREIKLLVMFNYFIKHHSYIAMYHKIQIMCSVDLQDWFF